MITRMHDLLNDVDYSPLEARCEDCDELANADGQFCDQCEPERWICPQCHGRGYIAQCRYCAAGECNCDAGCRCCGETGTIILSKSEGESHDLVRAQVRS
jgi:hypothetical protein